MGVSSIVITGPSSEPIRVLEGTPPEDVVTLHTIVAWAKAKGLPSKIIARIPELARRDALTNREIADEIAEFGYPWTANDLRSYWAPRTSPC